MIVTEILSLGFAEKKIAISFGKYLLTGCCCSIIEDVVVDIPEANIESNCCCLCGDKQKESRDGSGAIGATLGTTAIPAAK